MLLNKISSSASNLVLKTWIIASENRWAIFGDRLSPKPSRSSETNDIWMGDVAWKPVSPLSLLSLKNQAKQEVQYSEGASGKWLKKSATSSVQPFKGSWKTVSTASLKIKSSHTLSCTWGLTSGANDFRRRRFEFSGLPRRFAASKPEITPRPSEEVQWRVHWIWDTM